MEYHSGLTPRAPGSRAALGELKPHQGVHVRGHFSGQKTRTLMTFNNSRVLWLNDARLGMERFHIIAPICMVTELVQHSRLQSKRRLCITKKALKTPSLAQRGTCGTSFPPKNTHYWAGETRDRLRILDLTTNFLWQAFWSSNQKVKNQW